MALRVRRTFGDCLALDATAPSGWCIENKIFDKSLESFARYVLVLLGTSVKREIYISLELHVSLNLMYKI